MAFWDFIIEPKSGNSGGEASDPGECRLGPLAEGILSPFPARVYSIEFYPDVGREIGDAELARVLGFLLDPVSQVGRYRAGDAYETDEPDPRESTLDVRLRPGVLDPEAESVRAALVELGWPVVRVWMSRRHTVWRALSEAVRSNRLEAFQYRPSILSPLEEIVHPGTPLGKPIAARPDEAAGRMASVVYGGSDETLVGVAREQGWPLSLEELKAIQGHYRELGREPTSLEMRTFCEFWSEHCRHKTVTSPVVYVGDPMPLPPALPRGGGGGYLEGEGDAHSSAALHSDGSNPHPSPLPKREREPENSHPNPPTEVVKEPEVTIQYRNLLADTIFRATAQLRERGVGPTCLSVFEDNAGIIAFDDETAVAMKVETHNHPSALDPYHGAATGIGGCIRDVLGCGLGASPIASTDVFCVGPLELPRIVLPPPGTLLPRQILEGVTGGIRDYGNRVGVPTVNGAVHFDDGYSSNPLVFCGCVGILPRSHVRKKTHIGDRIVLVGGKTGLDGIGGGSFSSGTLGWNNVDATAVQIGDPIEEKKLIDLILRLRGDATGEVLFNSITDCGAGGLCVAVTELAGDLGADVDLSKVPLKYDRLNWEQIWISESQERMVLAVPEWHVARVLASAQAEDVCAAVLGQYEETGRIRIRSGDRILGELSLRFLHEGLPRPPREATWQAGQERPEESAWIAWVKRMMPSAAGAVIEEVAKHRPARRSTPGGHSLVGIPLADGLTCRERLLKSLRNPGTASKESIIRQYDHEVQGRTVIKPLVGPGEGPSDAAVLRPRRESHRGLAIACGFANTNQYEDPYWIGIAAMDEALRNVVCVGGDPAQTAVLDNLCWSTVADERSLGAIVRVYQACHDAALAYGLPFLSGKDSLNNGFVLTRDQTGAPLDTTGIPGTLLISALSIVDDIRRCRTMDLKSPGSRLYLVGRPSYFPDEFDLGLPAFDVDVAAATHRLVARLICEGLVSAVHDVSDGGVLVACAEMCIAGQVGCRLGPIAPWFLDDVPGMYVAEVPSKVVDAFLGVCPLEMVCLLGETEAGTGERDQKFTFAVPSGEEVCVSLFELRMAWRVE